MLKKYKWLFISTVYTHMLNCMYINVFLQNTKHRKID